MAPASASGGASALNGSGWITVRVPRSCCRRSVAVIPSAPPWVEVKWSQEEQGEFNRRADGEAGRALSVVAEPLVTPIITAADTRRNYPPPRGFPRGALPGPPVPNALGHPRRAPATPTARAQQTAAPTAGHRGGTGAPGGGFPLVSVVRCWT